MLPYDIPTLPSNYYYYTLNYNYINVYAAILRCSINYYTYLIVTILMKVHYIKSTVFYDTIF